MFAVDTSIKEPSILYWSREFWYTNGVSISLTDSQGNSLTEGTDYTLDLKDEPFAKLLVVN